MSKDFPVIEFTHAKVKQLRHAYREACSKGETRFLFDGHIMLTSFAYYLLQYLETKFKDH